MANRARLIGWLGAALVLAISCEASQPPVSSGGSSAPSEPGATITTDGGASTELGASTGTAAEVTDVLSQLVQTIDANAASYGPVDRADLNDLLTLALIRAGSPGGRGAASAQCASQVVSTHGFSGAQAAALCQDVRFDSAACAERAVSVLGFDPDSAAALCRVRGATETADCAQSVSGTLGLSRSQTVVACSDRDGADVVQCVTSAVNIGLDREQVAALCAGRGSAGTAECAKSALQTFGFSRDEAVALCTNRGAPETATCANTVFAGFGFSRQQAVALCSNRGQASNATCASNVLAVGLTRDQAVEACRRPATTLVP